MGSRVSRNLKYSYYNLILAVYNVTFKSQLVPKALLGSCKSMAEIEDKITHPRTEGNLQLMEVPALSRFTPRNVIIGQNRTIFFSMDAGKLVS